MHAGVPIVSGCTDLGGCVCDRNAGVLVFAWYHRRIHTSIDATRPSPQTSGTNAVGIPARRIAPATCYGFIERRVNECEF